jgi:hypothetical protein
MSGIGMRIAGVVTLAVGLDLVPDKDQVPDFCVLVGTRPVRDLDVNHQGRDVDEDVRDLGVSRVYGGDVVTVIDVVDIEVVGGCGVEDEMVFGVDGAGVTEGIVPGTTVTTIDVVKVRVVVTPIVAMVMVVVIGTVESDVFEAVVVDGFEVGLEDETELEGVAIDVEFGDFVIEISIVEVECVGCCVTVIPVIGAVVTDMAGEEGF